MRKHKICRLQETNETQTREPSLPCGTEGTGTNRSNSRARRRYAPRGHAARRRPRPILYQCVAQLVPNVPTQERAPRTLETMWGDRSTETRQPPQQHTQQHSIRIRDGGIEGGHGVLVRAANRHKQCIRAWRRSVADSPSRRGRPMGHEFVTCRSICQYKVRTGKAAHIRTGKGAAHGVGHNWTNTGNTQRCANAA